jgi:hypothetical protein
LEIKDVYGCSIPHVRQVPVKPDTKIAV